MKIIYIYIYNKKIACDYINKYLNNIWTFLQLLFTRILMHLKKNCYIYAIFKKLFIFQISIVNKNWKRKKEERGKIEVVRCKYNSNALSHSQRAFLSWNVYTVEFDIPYS